MSAVPVLEVRIAPEELAALYRDIAVLASVTSVRTEDGRGTRACGLGEAFATLEDRSAARVQIRYRFDDADWCDTLLLDGDAVRLVRVCDDHVRDAGDRADRLEHTPSEGPGAPDPRPPDLG